MNKYVVCMERSQTALLQIEANTEAEAEEAAYELGFQDADEHDLDILWTYKVDSFKNGKYWAGGPQGAWLEV